MSGPQQPDHVFIAKLKRSRGPVERIAAYLRRRGNAVDILPTRIRPTYAERFAYRDRGDLVVDGQRVEVRHRPSLTFTSADDYPFDCVTVDDVEKIDHADPKPLAYFQLNAAMTAAALVAGSTASCWQRRAFAGNGRSGYVYDCPVSLVAFVAIEGL